MRIYGNLDDGQYYPPAATCAEGADIGSPNNFLLGVYTTNLSESGTTIHVAYTQPRRQWFRMEFYLNAGTQGNLDGVTKLWTNGVLRATQRPTRSYLQDAYRFIRVSLGHYYDTGGPDMNHYISDAYIDITQQRVEIGNASSWSSCTHREIQIPSAWSDDSITITGNQGSFAVGNTAYLYVVDANGNVNSQGYGIIIGADTRPAPPKNLRIVN